MEGDNFVTPNTFYVKGKQKSLELHTKLVHILRVAFCQGMFTVEIVFEAGNTIN